MLNEVREFSLFSNQSPYIIPPEIPTEIHQLPFGFASGILYFQFERKKIPENEDRRLQFSSLVPVIIMFLIILIEARAYIFWYILPMLESSNSLNLLILGNTLPTTYKYLIQLLLFAMTSTNFLISTVLTITTPPGEVSTDLQLEAENIRENLFQVMISEKFLEKMKKFGNCESKRTMFPRFCRSCLMVKPDRSHHCSVCNKCILKMDHHCPYVNNCIGLKNYKYFMNMVISAAASSLMVTFTMWEGVKVVWESQEFDMEHQVLIGIAYFGNVVLSVVLTAFLSFHFYLISNALTTIEFREKMTVKFDASPYNLGVSGNFRDVFGRNPLFWCVPISMI